MKKESAIRNLLGVNQLELAMLLRVNRSQLAMFEAGQRDLPVNAKLLLAELLSHMQAPERAAKSFPEVTQQNEKLQQLLAGMLKENEYKLLTVARAKEVAEQQYTLQLKSLHVVDFFSRHSTNKGNSHQTLLDSIARKSTKIWDTRGLALRTQLDLKYEVLQFEKLMLESKLRHLVAASDFEQRD